MSNTYAEIMSAAAADLARTDHPDKTAAFKAYHEQLKAARAATPVEPREAYKAAKAHAANVRRLVNLVLGRR